MKQEIFDVKRKFVRVKGVMPNGFIEFEFAVGEPEVFVELVMPKPAFDEFCRNNQVETLGTAAPRAADAAEAADADFHWSLHQATHQRFR
ncbi:MAG TPA: phenol hydroxylase subunit [Rhodoferax sp.]